MQYTNEQLQIIRSRKIHDGELLRNGADLEEKSDGSLLIIVTLEHIKMAKRRMSGYLTHKKLADKETRLSEKNNQTNQKMGEPLSRKPTVPKTNEVEHLLTTEISSFKTEVKVYSHKSRDYKFQFHVVFRANQVKGLKNMGIFTVKDLIKFTRAELIGLKGMTKSSLTKGSDELKKHGLSFFPDLGITNRYNQGKLKEEMERYRRYSIKGLVHQ